MRMKKVPAFPIFIIVAVVVVIVFTLMDGDTLIENNDSVNRWILDTLHDNIKIGMLSEDPAVRAYLPERFGYKKQLDDMNLFVEDAIHVVLFFILALSVINFLKFRQFSLKYKLLIAAAICMITGYGTEVFQNIVADRGYEDRDVLNNNIGTLCGIVFYSGVYFIGNVIQKSRKHIKLRKKVVIKYISGKDFFS